MIILPIDELIFVKMVIAPPTSYGRILLDWCCDQLDRLVLGLSRR